MRVGTCPHLFAEFDAWEHTETVRHLQRQVDQMKKHQRDLQRWVAVLTCLCLIQTFGMVEGLDRRAMA